MCQRIAFLAGFPVFRDQAHKKLTDASIDYLKICDYFVSIILVGNSGHAIIEADVVIVTGEAEKYKIRLDNDPNAITETFPSLIIVCRW